VPLSLEGPTRTMRGVPAPLTVTSSRFMAHLAHGRRSGRGAGERGSGIRRGPQRPVTWGAVRGSSARLVGLRPKGATKSCHPATASPPGEPEPLMADHPGRSFPRLLAFVLAIHGRGRQARRAQGAPLMIVNDREENPHSTDMTAVGSTGGAIRSRLLEPVESCPDGATGVVSVDAPLVCHGTDDV
jgi:hypothetical protein